MLPPFQNVDKLTKLKGFLKAVRMIGVVNINLYFSVNVTAVMFLSWPPRKEPKEGGIGEALRKVALPYVPHPPHRHPASKNVPIFERLPLKSPQVCPM